MSSELLIKIATCDIARRHIEDPAFSSPCREIVCSQGAPTWDQFQCPEPWNGFIESAPILYLSSNSSISESENYPRESAAKQRLFDFFERRFEGHWVADGTRPRETDDSYGSPVRLWCGIRARTTELLGRPAVPAVITQSQRLFTVNREKK